MKERGQPARFRVCRCSYRWQPRTMAWKCKGSGVFSAVLSGTQPQVADPETPPLPGADSDPSVSRVTSSRYPRSVAGGKANLVSPSRTMRLLAKIDEEISFSRMPPSRYRSRSSPGRNPTPACRDRTGCPGTVRGIVRYSPVRPDSAATSADRPIAVCRQLPRWLITPPNQTWPVSLDAPGR